MKRRPSVFTKLTRKLTRGLLHGGRKRPTSTSSDAPVPPAPQWLRTVAPTSVAILEGTVTADGNAAVLGQLLASMESSAKYLAENGGGVYRNKLDEWIAKLRLVTQAAQPVKDEPAAAPEPDPPKADLAAITADRNRLYGVCSQLRAELVELEAKLAVATGQRS